MVKALEAAIPGQSLTDEPRNYAWERPPEIADPNEAVVYHLERITTEEVLDNVLFAIEYGVPTGVLAEMMCSGAVANGIHSIDVSLIIKPVVQEYLNATAKQAGIEYREEFGKEEENAELAKQKAISLVKKSIKANKDKDAGADFLEEMTQEAPMDDMEQEMPEAPEEDMQMEMDLGDTEKPRGLMARG